MSDPQWFKDDPEFAWGFWSHRYHLYNNCQPHTGFDIMKKWCDTITPQSWFCFTSNVDGGWQKMGFPEEKVYECHGTVHRLQCTEPCSNKIWETDPSYIPSHSADFRIATELIPMCIYCNKVARPCVMMFGDSQYIEDYQEQKYKYFDQIGQYNKVVVVEIGAGEAVPTVRYFGESVVQNNESYVLIRINPNDYEIPFTANNRHVSIPLGGLEALQKIDCLL
eukprot:TRINITY_DN4356_c0_g1_i2.p1 TRINITY_DN4356_c0_g1~~TRINITY_DN4356_c0_g1_i2.p1  ORF type:complete len:222 (-),score=28.45 TRINITY_DN4356_c0_g1_i2:89-754(-)